MQPPPDRAKLQELSVQALKTVWDDFPFPPAEQDQHVEKVVAILHINLSSGRCKRANGGKECATENCLHVYAQRVAKHYWIEHEAVTGLAAKDPTLWKQLYDRLEKQATYICIRHGAPARKAKEQARDYAQEACERIFRNHYPCDVPFEAWTGKILVHCILHPPTRSKDVLDRSEFADATFEELWDSERFNLTPLSFSQPFYKDPEVLVTLLNAVEQLSSEAQRQVILLEFFFEWEPDQIARALGKTKQAVYNLKHRALRELKEVLFPNDC
ncbi:MAG: sigma-70 family RNA polymerase sigma factor [Anaerolineae bacterium]|nr:sigma-70 family RNA polymerase sigma factor [Anaerolineae bacterium]